LLVLDILKTEKSRVRDRFISYSKYSRQGTLFIQKKVTRQDKFESILEIIEYVVSSPFVKAEADSVDYFGTVFETVCASSLAMCAYQIGEHLHLL
jgi:hypothetical protein